MEINTKVTGSGAGKKMTVSDAIFGVDYNESLIHQAVTSHLAGGRAGTKAQKNRSDVSGGGRKPWRQKGTGRARAGSIRSPLWRSGGVTFAARPRDFSQKMNRKAYRVAMRSIFSELVRQDRFMVVDKFSLKAPKTKDAAALLKEYELSNVLIILPELDTNVALAMRNIPNVQILDVANINPVDLIAFEKVLVTVDTIAKIEEKLQ